MNKKVILLINNIVRPQSWVIHIFFSKQIIAQAQCFQMMGSYGYANCTYTDYISDSRVVCQKGLLVGVNSVFAVDQWKGSVLAVGMITFLCVLWYPAYDYCVVWWEIWAICGVFFFPRHMYSWGHQNKLLIMLRPNQNTDACISLGKNNGRQWSADADNRGMGLKKKVASSSSYLAN